MESRFIIYGLTDPRTGEVRYIGQSSRGDRRPREQMRPSSLACDSYKNRWLRQLKSLGLRYRIEILEDCSSRDILDTAEQRWIAIARRDGWPITNCTDGGGGLPSPTEETRRKMSARQMGRKHSEHTRTLIAEGRRGWRHTEEVRKRISEKKKGIATRVGGTGCLGYRHTPEHIERIRAIARARRRRADGSFA